jgi:hypothetical protein
MQRLCGVFGLLEKCWCLRRVDTLMLDIVAGSAMSKRAYLDRKNSQKFKDSNRDKLK